MPAKQTAVPAASVKPPNQSKGGGKFTVRVKRRLVRLLTETAEMAGAAGDNKIVLRCLRYAMILRGEKPKRKGMDLSSDLVRLLKKRDDD